MGQTVNGSCPQANISIVQFSEQEAEDYYTKETAIRLSNELRKFAESLDSKDNIKTKEKEMADEKNLSEEEDKDVVMSETEDENKEANDPKSEEQSEDKNKELAEEETAEFADEDENKEMSEDEADEEVEKEEVEDENKEMSEEVEMACEDEKEFSIAEFASKELIESIEDEKVGEFIKMSADDMIKAFAEIVNQNKTLMDYKTNVEMAERDEKVNGILASVKLDLSEEQYKTFSEEAKEVSLECVDAFANKVKAFAYENAKTKVDNTKNDEVFVFAGVDDDNANKEDDDVFSRLAKL